MITSSLPTSAHQPFRVLSNEHPVTAADEPVLKPTSVFNNIECSIFEGANDGKFYAVPNRFYRVPSKSNAVLGASLEDSRQRSLIVTLVHGIDQKRISGCIEAFVATRATTTEVLIYPAQISDIALLGDPHDRKVLRFSYTTSSVVTFSNQLQVFTILQTTCRQNVIRMKKFLRLEASAIATVKVRTLNSSGNVIYTPLTLPLSLGNIQLSSQTL